MKKNTSKLIIAFVLTAIVAYVAGAYFQFPPTSGKAAGEVGRVKAFTSNIVEIDADNIQERLKSDSVFCSQLTHRAILMQIQANSLAEFIRKSNELVGGNDSLQVALDVLNVPYQSVLNACKAIDTYVDNLSILSNGGKVKGFEQIYNNALLGYYLVNSKSELVDSFKDDVKKFMSDLGDNDDLAYFYDSWTGYSLCGKLLVGNATSLDLRASQEVLEQLYRIASVQFNENKNQEQLNWYMNQEQLSVWILMCYRNQEQLNWRNQEQLNWRNQEQLSWRNQEQLNIATPAL